MKTNQKIIILFFLVVIFTSCKKEFLNEKPVSGITVPTSLDDFQRLLNNITVMNEVPEFLELGTDDWDILSYPVWQGRDNSTRNGYVFSPEIYEGQTNIRSWNIPYEQIYYANIILEGLEKLPVTTSNEAEWKRTKGCALFVRAYNHYTLAQLFAAVYDLSSAANDLGIPVKLTADINNKSKRSSVLETYSQIVSDLKEAEALVENNVDPQRPYLASKPGVFAMLSRVYLSMSDYEKAGDYANKCLQKFNDLIDYSTLSLTSAIPFNVRTDGLIYLAWTHTGSNLYSSNAVIKNEVFQSYHTEDLRKTIFFRNVSGNLVRKRYQNITGAIFTGLATDEVYLNRAECYAREGQIGLAMKDLNDLLRTRWEKNPDGSTKYIDQVAGNAADALAIILTERRKELVMRGLRWTDLRRLNREGANITVRRVLNGVEYTLPPNDKRWVYPIPPDEIALSGIEQNER